MVATGSKAWCRAQIKGGGSNPGLSHGLFLVLLNFRNAHQQQQEQQQQLLPPLELCRQGRAKKTKKTHALEFNFWFKKCNLLTGLLLTPCWQLKVSKGRINSLKNLTLMARKPSWQYGAYDKISSKYDTGAPQQAENLNYQEAEFSFSQPFRRMLPTG